MANNPIDNSKSIIDSLGLKTPQRTKSNELGQAQFLELMTAQLRNQDPMKPMENGEFLSQMAQFGTVNGITELQKSFGTLASSLQSNQALMASGMVGRRVLVPSEIGELNAQGLMGAADLPTGASDMVVTITDASGAVVNRLSYGPQNAGLAKFVWDGRAANGATMPAGLYKVKVEAVNGTSITAAASYTQARVDSVSLGGTQGLTLNLGGQGTATLSDVKEIA